MKPALPPMRKYYHVSLVIGGDFENWWKLNCTNQPKIVLWRVHQYGFYCVEHVERGLCHTRVFNVHELLHCQRIRKRLLQTE